MKGIENTKFATATIITAQILSGLGGISLIIGGMVGLASGEVQGGLISIASGFVSLGNFFALARILNLGTTDKDA